MAAMKRTDWRYGTVSEKLSGGYYRISPEIAQHGDAVIKAPMSWKIELGQVVGYKNLTEFHREGDSYFLAED